MKILNIKFQNLNSLIGQWEIDFTHPEFQEQGIFAITGQTGAGKTTILDAMCLALYGRTPRLGKITETENEIMSRQAGECFAELTFQTQKGQFRCHWSQRKARNKAQGKLQSPKHEIVNAENNHILENHIRKVSDKIEEVTGMDFDRFTRSMLLAQGSFAAFLQANANERSPILEQITGTEIYSQISKAVHDRKNQENQQYEELKKHIHDININLLSTEEEQEISSNLLIKKSELEKLNQNILLSSKTIQIHQYIQSLEQEQNQLSQQYIDLTKQKQDFELESQQLHRAQQALLLESDWTNVFNLREQLKKEKIQYEQLLNQLPNIKQLTQESFSHYQESAKQQDNFQNQLDKNEIIWQNITLQDNQINQLNQQINNLSKQKQDLTQKINENNQNKKLLSENLIKIQNQITQHQDYLSKHAHDEWLIQHFSLLEQEIKQLNQLKEQIQAIEHNQNNQQQKYHQLTQDKHHLLDSHAQILNTQNKLNQEKQILESKFNQLLNGETLREWQLEKDFLHQEQILRAKIASLEEHRQDLHDGQPCPLCGALSHPFAENQQNIPQVSEIQNKISILTQKIQQLEELEKERQTLQQSLESQEKQLLNIDYKIKHHQQELDFIQQAINQSNQDLNQYNQEFINKQHDIWAKLSPLGFNQPKNFPAVLSALKQRLESWQTHLKQYDESKKQESDFIQKIDKIDLIIQENYHLLEPLENNLSTLNQEIKFKKQERFNQFGEKNPEQEKNDFIKNFNQIKQQTQFLNQIYQQKQQELIALESRLTLLSNNLQELTDLLAKTESNWQQLYPQYHFKDEMDFLSARLSESERQLLQEKSNQIQQDIHANQIKQGINQKNLTESKHHLDNYLMELNINLNIDLEKLQEFHDYQNNLSKEMGEIISKYKITLENHYLNQEKNQTQQIKLQKQYQEYCRWLDLHQLIGSADGKKFRNFAQGLTFEQMVYCANAQLQKMTDRYTLIRHDNAPLELNVIDHYQAGEIRTTKNLSGGESFIVSLALALGLSQMSSQNVRVDSLFLDEGFGTLDEDALEIALDTLSHLQQEGKLIGVISHVSALKERISTQIQVEPISGGRSMLSGVGCRKLD